MRKGVILEINDLYLTLLTPEGEFLRARKLQQDYQVGEEIHFFPEMGVTTSKRKKLNFSALNSFKAKTIALAAAIMLMMTAILPVYQNGKVYAYMSIDVNPSVEMAVSDELKVLRIKGYNTEGKEIIKGIEGWKKKDAAIVAEMILEEIEEKGFLKGNNNVIIATVPNGKVKEKVEKKLEQKIAEIKKATKEEKLELKVIDGTSEEREDAREMGVTTGVYKSNLMKENKLKSEPAKSENKPATQKPAKPVQQPEKQAAPGQIKKSEPEPPKVKSAKPQAPGAEKKNDLKQNGNAYKSQSKNNNEKKVQKVVKSKANNNGQQVKKERNRLKQDNNGHSGKSNGNSNKK